MNQILALILVLFTIASTKAQPFEWTDNNHSGSGLLNIIEKDGGLYAVTGTGPIGPYDPDVQYQFSIYKIIPEPGTANFQMEEVVTIPSPDTFATSLVGYIKETKRWIVFQTHYEGGYRFLYRNILYDENFNFIAQKTLDTLGSPNIFFDDTEQGESYILGSISSPPENEIFLTKYSHQYPDSLPSIAVSQSDPEPMIFISSMSIDPRTRNMLVFHYNGIVEMDTNFHQTNTFDFDLVKTYGHGTVLGSGNHYYSHGASPQYVDHGPPQLVLHQYDTLFNILVADTFGVPDFDNEPFLTTSLDIRNDKLLVGGHLKGPLTSTITLNSTQRYYLAKYDTDMNQLWYKEYGGDRPYVMLGLKLASDGGGYAYGVLTDSGTFIRHAYIMRVDENGENLSSLVIEPASRAGIEVVSPGDGILRVLNPNGIDGRIELYDLQGCRVIAQDLVGLMSEYETSNLANGLYPYRVIQGDGIISRGKWLKTQ